MKKGFTLSEVLITLGIIGVVAAMTIPTLMGRMQAIKLQTQFKEAYSILSRAVRQYNADDERTDADITTNSNQTMYKSFLKYFQGATDCGDAVHVAKDSEYCFIRNSSGTLNQDKYYKNYARNSKFITTYYLDDGQFYLQNGMLIAFNTSSIFTVSIDINGKKAKPNAWGQDVFTFQLIESEKEGGLALIPMGAPGSTFIDKNQFCSKTSWNINNGIACTYYAIKESDYFKNLP